MIIYFGLGSNLGNRLQNLRLALEMLKSIGHVVKASDVFETKAWGGVKQPDYLNACVKIERETDTAPSEILPQVKTFEREIGRVESVRWGARKIDIDILLIDDIVFHSDELDVPHIRIPERLFVLVPLSQVLPSWWKHPVNGKSVSEMMREIECEAVPLRVTELDIVFPF
ncbi:MAG: 2-amino-4-hydroxy-6-hydroxymethyldihydropteridine diphosphokinase [Synergistaceae bacterium]|nr:2-amino-4-hydroxy-6-hydroxymethyldihydropteridine diphosphokinase [Synergistaceae bacterium]